jgi:acyl-CoA reductase-like NAD-dependent aldehyde dehydrogenase
MLRSKLAPGARCALEHGGAAPLFVAPDADLDLAVPAVAKGGFYHAGQVCVSVQRVYAHRSVAREFAERLAAAADAQTIGDPTLPGTEVGPLIRPAEVERVRDWVEEAVAAGAERLAGGAPLSASCYPCTVLFDPPADAKVSTLEIFGPVVCVYPYDALDEAIARANALPFAFQAAVFTRDLDTALRVYARVAASAVMINDHTAFRVDGMPFAGLRQSGLGVGGIGHSIADMQVEKMMVVKSGELGLG